VLPYLVKNGSFSRKDSFPSVQELGIKDLSSFSWHKWISTLDSAMAVLASAEYN